MPARESGPNGAPCWIDLTTSDVDKARRFYTELLGWEAEEGNPEFGGYFNFRSRGARVAGCMTAQPGMPADFWSVYLQTDDAQKTTEAAKANGGQAYVDPMPVGDLGSMGYLGDSSGASVGIWQPGAHRGFGRVAEPGAPSWFELHTRDYDKALTFYRAVFDWNTESMSDTPEFRYTVMKHGDDELAGVFDASTDLAEGEPSRWTVYFGVEDTDAAVAKAVELGGSVIQPAEDTPYGRLAEVTDCNGARLKLVAANEAMPAKPDA
jgi:predicted enzyme related to lactoylglutathione lyase